MPTSSATQQANVDLVAGLGPLTGPGFSSPNRALFADDFVFHVANPGLPELAGDHHGVDGFVRLFGQLRSAVDRELQSVAHSLTPYGDERVGAFATHTLSFGGGAIEVDAIVVWRVVDGRFAEAWDIPAVNTVRPVGQDAESKV